MTSVVLGPAHRRLHRILHRETGWMSEHQQCDFADMLWKWFEHESRIGKEGMRPMCHEGLSSDDFKEMLDEHEAALLAQAEKWQSENTRNAAHVVDLEAECDRYHQRLQRIDTPAQCVQPIRALAEELREYTAMKYAGDCKCGKCQLVPRALVERIYHVLNGSALTVKDRPPRQIVIEEGAPEHTEGQPLPPDENFPDCGTRRERELYFALMGLSSAVLARFQGSCRNWIQGGIRTWPVVEKALRLDEASQHPSTQHLSGDAS